MGADLAGAKVGDEKSEARGSTFRLIEAQRRIMKQRAAGATVDELLEITVDFIESVIEGATGSVLLYDAERSSLTYIAGRSLPAEFTDTIVDAPIGEFGACSRAAFDDRPVYVSDTEKDPNFVDLQGIVEAYDFRAAWSRPLHAHTGELIGTMGLYFHTAREPTEDEKADFEDVAELASMLMSEDRQAQRVQRERNKFQTVVDSVKDAIVVLDAEGSITYASPYATELLEVDEGALLRDAFALSERPRIERAIAGAIEDGKSYTRELVRGVDGESWFRCVVSPMHDQRESGAVVTLSDVTRRKALDERIHHAERMSTVGTLAAGVAHEINNPLTFLSGNLAYIRGALEKEIDEDTLHEIRAALADAMDGTERVSEIVKDLHSFAKAGMSKVERLRVEDVVESATRLAGRQFHHHCEIVLEIDPELEVVAGERELVQILVNLTINAADAIEESAIDAGEIRVLTKRRDGLVALGVRDNGAGISEEHQARLFEPFFTTKAPDRGTGLGLAIVYQLAERFGIRLDVESTLGEGATFWLVFPPTPDDTHDLTESSEIEATGTLRVLVIDDDPAIRATLVRNLNQHRVDLAEGGEEALEILTDDRDFDIILLDMMMPELSGEEVYRAIASRWPETEPRVSFMTGGLLNGAERDIVRADPDRCLLKPFSSRELATFLQDRLPAGGS